MALKTWKVSLPDNSPVLKDLLELGAEMGMQPAETTRVILTEWSRALRGRTAFGGLPQFIGAPQQPQTEMQAPVQKNEIQQAKTRGTKFARSITLDED